MVACLATLKSSDRTKQSVCGWQYIYIYIYSHKIKRCFLQAAMDALHGHTRILNKSWRQHPTKQQLYSHLPTITKTIKVIRTRHAGHCLRSRDELISDVLLWTPSPGRAKAGRPARTYIQQLSEDTGCSPEDLPEAINDRSDERGSGISVQETRQDNDDLRIISIWY